MYFLLYTGKPNLNPYWAWKYWIGIGSALDTKTTDKKVHATTTSAAAAAAAIAIGITEGQCRQEHYNIEVQLNAVPDIQLDKYLVEVYRFYIYTYVVLPTFLRSPSGANMSK